VEIYEKFDIDCLDVRLGPVRTPPEHEATYSFVLIYICQDGSIVEFDQRTSSKIGDESAEVIDISGRRHEVDIISYDGEQFREQEEQDDEDEDEDPDNW